MSEQEFHIGTLREIKPKSHQTIDDIMLAILGEQDIDYEEKHTLVSYFQDGSVEGYHYFNDKVYKIEDKGYEDNDICVATQNVDGSISYVLGFYNGGTCMSEMLEYALENLK